MPDTNVARPCLAPFSLKDAPALIERVFPAQKVGIEAQKERKAGPGQTLTALGSYWKGRKPLVLVRATVLASLLPSTEDPQADLEIFDLLMRMDEEGIWRREPSISADDVLECPAIDPLEKLPHVFRVVDEKGKITSGWTPIKLVGYGRREDRDAERARILRERVDLRRRAVSSMPFSRQVSISKRLEEVEDLSLQEDPLYEGVWEKVNHHLGTTARSVHQLVEQLGVARFGHRPIVGDPFAGGGSIPFEAARSGCSVVASDLNPIAAMLTWGALNVIGADDESRARIIEEQSLLAATVDNEIIRLGIEHDAQSNRAKAYLYCLETVDPQTGWRVPMCPSWVISNNRRCAARLDPDYAKKCFNIIVESGLSKDEMTKAAQGTVRDGHLVYSLAPIQGEEEREWRIPVSRLRGDGEGSAGPDGSRNNKLRAWELSDFEAREPSWVAQASPVVPGSAPGAWIGGDVFLERLYAIQWLSALDLQEGKARPETWFDGARPDDLERERRVAQQVRDNIAEWQANGFVPDMRIEPGEKTDEPIRTRGWTYWHHLFSPRALLRQALYGRYGSSPVASLSRARDADRTSKLCRWNADPQPTQLPKIEQVFSNQALNTLYNWGVYSDAGLEKYHLKISHCPMSAADFSLETHPASATKKEASLWIFDPPYADAVHYHEITEFFIAWLRKNPPAPFDQWTWDSRRPLAIQGKGEAFRREMVAAFSAMAGNMPDNGLQVCMFTHKDAGVWADMAGIVWASGLRVTAAWYVSTETSSELKKGGYVQGTVLLVLRKRTEDEYGFKSEIVPEVRARVQAQVETLTGLNQSVRGGGRDENLFSDADIQMAGYAAALEVLTTYTHIDGVDMTREALRPREERRRGQPAPIGLVEEMISLAVSTATELMVPEGIPEAMWDRLPPATRFYLRMTTAEGEWPAGSPGGKLDEYQNFAKAYRAEGWEDLMAERAPNRARLKTATEFRAALLRGHPVADGPLRPTLYAIMSLARDADREVDPETSGKAALHGLRDHFGEASWLGVRDNVRALATWFGRTWSRRNPAEAVAARVLAGLIGSERL
ncbi:DUF1156 domain-containing protein [Roseomonas nepalensis]|uniref:DUF1156 domain-containing protein n=1 Tax=Muricoccus nepalensis TaxID=1854500 RepID=A0A502G133_9PROT|nr:anti-phage-associated DUF1156 domain-containing protein [Roseomonas nepalensis]TPG55475.1 DUF1156 domain-containing protein [Roseomonas nepalensis]